MTALFSLRKSPEGMGKPLDEPPVGDSGAVPVGAPEVLEAPGGVLPDSTSASEVLTKQSLRFVVRRGSNASPVAVMANDKAEVMERLAREIIMGQSQEIHLYEYVGTIRAVRTTEVVNIFTDEASKS